MYPANSSKSPGPLKPGQHYFLKISRESFTDSVYEEVIFLEVTSSPIVVIVRDHTGHVLRISRSNLISKSEFGDMRKK